MNISFQKLPGEPNLGIAFFWRLALETSRPTTLTDSFIPELFYDYFLVETGAVHLQAGTGQAADPLPPQVLKTLHTRPVTLVFSTPLVLYGARFNLNFAETFWQPAPTANCFLEQSWVSHPPGGLAAFATQLRHYLPTHQARQHPYPLLSPALEESGWLVNFSPRHKRRLYQSVFGLSRQALQRVAAVHAFLEQTCDFAAETPRIISHLNPEVFYDQAHLNHVFKQLTGFSPLEYFQVSSILQDNLMAASYNAPPADPG